MVRAVRVRALYRRIIAARQERRLRPEETPVETCGKTRCCSSSNEHIYLLSVFSDLHALSLFGVHSVYFACTQIIEIFVLVERFTANLEIQCEPAFVLRHGRWAAGSELLRVSPPCKCSLPQPNRIYTPSTATSAAAAAGGHRAEMATQSRAVFAHRQHAVGNRWCVPYEYVHSTGA